MQHLKTISKVIYLEASIATIKRRINEIPRGIVGLKDRTFEDLYIERTALYTQWADYTVDTEQESAAALEEILHLLL
jgi:shikimate kinase